MCALAMMSFATQAQDDVIYEISSTPATELVKDHIYVLQNHAYPAYGLFYNNNNGCASTYEWNEDLLVQCMPYQYFFLTAGADGITLPVTLTNINDNGEMDYGNTGGGTVLSRPSYAPNPDEPVYFTVKDAAGQLAMLLYNVEYEYCDLYGVIYGGENTTPAECAQWIAYEVTEHEHNWKIVYDEDQSYCHHCTKCDVEERHYVAEEDGKCVCGYQCSEHSYHMDDYASVKATENADGQYIVVKRCEYCNHEKTETVDPDGECPKGGNHSWADDGTINATCTAKGYTYHICKKCEMLYVADFTPVNRNNHNWVLEQQWNEEGEFVSMHFCCNGCEAHGNLEEHTMDENGKCTVCGYWPGHTEHQWEADPGSHHCTIPGCEEHGGWEEHEIEGCVCTICGNACHEWCEGVCNNCDAECEHQNNVWYEAARPATCLDYGHKTGFYQCECGLYFADEDCTRQLSWEDEIYISATGHSFDEDGTCTKCSATVTVAGTLSFEEENTVTFWNECYKRFEDPTAAPLYSFECDGNGNLTISSETELSNALLFIFDSNFHYMGTWEFMDIIWIEIPGTYYLIPTYFEEDEEDEKIDGQTITLSWEGETVCQHTDFESVDNWNHICKECGESFEHYIEEDGGQCVCGFKCTKHRFYALAIASVEATENINDGEIYVVEECEYCHVQGEPKVVDTKSECTESKNHNHFWVRYTTDVMPTTEEGGIAKISCWYCDESYFVRVPVDRDACTEYWGHNWYESEGNIVCSNEDCGKTITPATLAMGENAGIGVDASVHHYYCDPSSAPLYKFVPENSGPYDFKIKDNASADCKVFIFETNEDDHLDMNIQDGDHYAFEARKNYYLQFLTTDVDGDRNPIAYEGATIVVSESTQLVIAAAADASDDSEPVVIVKVEETGEWATTQNIVLKDGVESFSTPVDFTAPKVDYERLMPNSQWGTLCLPFDITVDAAGKPYDFYELTSATSTEVTLTKVPDGILQANTPVIVRRNASETGVHFTETDVTVKTNRGYSDGEEKDGLQMIGVFTPYELYGGSYYLDAVDGKLYDTGAYYNKTGDPVKVNAYRCYFDVVGGHDEARALNINFEEEEVSSIEAIDALTSGKAEFYDLQGRERSELQSGLNVLRYGNGKSVKVIIK